MMRPLSEILTHIEMITYEIFNQLKSTVEEGGHKVELRLSWNSNNITIYSNPQNVLYMRVLVDRVECGDGINPAHVFHSHDPEFFDNAVRYGQSEIVRNSVV